MGPWYVIVDKRWDVEVLKQGGGWVSLRDVSDHYTPEGFRHLVRLPVAYKTKEKAANKANAINMMHFAQYALPGDRRARFVSQEELDVLMVGIVLAGGVQ